WRFGTVIAVVAAVWPLYFLARGLLGRRVAFVALGFYAASPLLLAYERTGYLYALSILPVVTGAALTDAAARRDSRLYAFLAGAASGAGYMLYPSAQFGVVLCALILVAFVAGRLMRGAPALRLSLSFVSAVILSMAPALVYGLVREPAAFIDRAFQSSMVNVAFAETVVGRDELLARASFITTRDSQLFFEPAFYAGYALRGWLRTAIGLHRSDLVSEHYVVGPLAGPLTLLYLLGLGWCLARARRPGYAIWPIWWFAGTFLLSAIASFPPHTSDLLPIVPALAVLAAVGLVGALDSLAQIVGHARQAGAVLIASTLAVGALGLRAYFVEMPQRYPPSLEMRMFWSALDLPRGSTIVFVRDETYAPGFQPWGMQNFNTAAGWQMIEPAALSSFDFRSACAIDCRVFYTSAHAGATETRLRETVGPGAVTAYVNEAGEAIGYAFDPAGKP
ncbi:MAG TPA: glycosyltransferase family 39 protein, partial [Anaerolineae bacterium]|nr:glycosyltransferase family 39 protein [Anaerolineae bacterium]